MRQTKQQMHALAFAALGLTFAAGATLGVGAAPASAAKPPAAPRRAKAPRAAANVITVVSVSSGPDGSTRIVLTGARAFRPELRNENGANGATVAVEGAVLAGGAGSTLVDKNGVGLVRYAAAADGGIEVVASPAPGVKALPTSLQGSPDGKRWEVSVWAPEAPGAPAPRAEGRYPELVAKKPAIVAKQPAVTVVERPQPTAAGAIAAAITPARPAGSFAPAALVPVAAPPAAPVAAVVPTAARQNPAAPAAVTLQDATERRVSLDFVAADINDVLKALSLQSGINIVTGADVKGNITVSLKRISLPEALDMVTRLSGFQYARFGSAYVVGTPSSVASITAGGKPSAEPVTGFIRYRYTPTAQLYKVLAEKFPGVRLPELDKDPAAGSALAGPAFPKMLVVTDAKERVEAVGAFVETLEGQIQLPTLGSATEVYRIKYANPNDLITILSRLVPTVAVQVGPNQVFQGASGNGSATFGGGGSFGPTAGGAGGAGAAGGAGGAGAAGGSGANLGAGNNGGTANPVGPAGANLLLITGAPSDIARAREVLNQIDIKTSQIIYEARVVDVNASDLQQLGLRYDLSRSVNIGESNTQATRGGIGAPSIAGEFPGRNPSFGAILRSPYSIGVTLDALANNNRARTLANPNLAALDGQPATAFIGDQIKYVIAVQQTQQGQTIQTETATVGITLRVTGKSSPDGTITLYVHPEVSSVTSFLNLSNGISLPQIATRFVDTTIRVKDGETIAIGGLIREQDVKNLQKVPLVGDLPLLGQLFRRSEKRKERSELVVFVTARIAKD